MKHLKQKSKIEFSKKWLIGCILISCFFTLFSYVLAWFDKNTNEALTIAIVQTMWSMDGVCFIGYVFQNSMRAWSINKFGKSEIPNETTEENSADEIIEDGRD